MIQLHGFQSEVFDRAVPDAWAAGARNVLAELPTGAGKTVGFAHVIRKHQGQAVAIAHRQELVSQISLALCREDLRHTIIGPTQVVQGIIRLQREELGACWYDPAAHVAVAGVDTLTARAASLAPWGQQVTLWVLDEAHHQLEANKWGKAAALFPNARGLGVTATPGRADGKGLGRHADGLFDELVRGPSMRWLIDHHFLTDYTILAPPSGLDLSSVPIGATGDFTHARLAQAVHDPRSHLVGDVVDHYKKHALGKLGVTFVVDVAAAVETAARFNDQGVPAAVITAKTPDRERYHFMREFRARRLWQIVNVDILGEGVDVPGIEVVSMARPTASLNVFVQQFGRMLRVCDGKERGLLLDHVGNTLRHNGPPDFPRVWTLDRSANSRSPRDPDVIPMKVCNECTRPFEATCDACPYCGHKYAPERRDGPQYVDGDLVELDAAALAALRGEVARIDESPEALRARMVHAGASQHVAHSAARSHRQRQAAQATLRRLLAVWGGLQVSRGRSDSEARKRFFFRYGIDTLSACALGRPDAEKLSCALLHDLGRATA